MLYIVRHGQTDWNNLDKIQGVADVPLNDIGRAQANIAADRLARFNFEYIVSSNLSRATETANIIGNKLNLRVEYDARLREYDFGKLTGMIRRMLDPHEIEAFFTTPTYFGAESFEDAFARSAEFLKSGGVINFMLCYLESRDNFKSYMFLDKCLNTHIDNSAVLRIRDLKSDMTILKNTRFYKLPRSK